ncbi:hypothetical protein Nepgr_014806 [Nepenthes gracilis]|uniref:Uncharacterized protein n=1 Tax=Nepenthes gracilis TaxID=150966 RepID=A0AAD3SJX8_NEPGR|nr:hypothetical protein Nepgr_014806 [Nepenthes gracilis]
MSCCLSSRRSLVPAEYADVLICMLDIPHPFCLGCMDGGRLDLMMRQGEKWHFVFAHCVDGAAIGSGVSSLFFVAVMECSDVSGAIEADGAYFDRLLVPAVSFFWMSWNSTAHGMDNLLSVVVLNCLCFCLLNHLKDAEGGLGLLLESCFQNLLHCIYGLLLVVVRRGCLAESASPVWCWGWLCGTSAPIADSDELVDSAAVAMLLIGLQCWNVEPGAWSLLMWMSNWICCSRRMLKCNGRPLGWNGFVCSW